MAPLSLYPCRGLNEGVVLYDNEALEKLVNVNDLSRVDGTDGEEASSIH